MIKKEKIKILILAAGKGTRMKSDLPKALQEIRGKSMIKHLIESIEEAGVTEIPVIVVGYGKEKVMTTLGEKYDYVIQEEQLGTGHAVMVAEDILKDKADNIMVIYSDNPLISSETIKTLTDKHITTNAKITMATVKLPDFEDWRSVFYKNFSRIIRDTDGDIVKVVQVRDATEKEKEITEVNPCYFIFDANWLWKKLKAIKTNNAQKEYYLTDLISIATEEKTKIQSIEIDATEALGANSKEELEILEKLVVQ